MLVTFWSYKAGQSGTTSNLGAIASLLSIKYMYINTIFSTKFTRSTLDRLFLSDDILEDLESTQLINTGVDALFKNMQTNKVDENLIKDFATSIVSRRLDLLISTKSINKELYLKIFTKSLEEYAEAIKEFSFIDLEAGLDFFITNKALELADLVVVNINQNKHILDEMFTDIRFIEMAETKKMIYIVGNYDKNSNLNVRNLSKRYGIPKNLIFTIPYNRNFADYCSNNQVLEFILNNMRAKKKEENYEFVKNVEKCVYGILDAFELERGDYLIDRDE